MDKLTQCVLSAIGSEEGKMLPSGWVIECKNCVGRNILVYVSERSADSFKDNVFTFSEEAFMDFVKDNADSLIAVVEEGNPEHLHIIDPLHPSECGFTVWHSTDECGQKYYHYIKNNSRYGEKLGEVIADAITNSMQPIAKELEGIKTMLEKYL